MRRRRTDETGQSPPSSRPDPSPEPISEVLRDFLKEWQSRKEPKRPWREWIQTFVTALPGLAAAIALIFTWQSINATKDATNRQLQVAEQGQVTDRYNAAIANLGSSSEDIRLGGIYALQRIMQDSPRDQPTVIAVLCAFVRNHAPEPPQRVLQSATRPPADIQAALTVVGFRNTVNGDMLLDLNHTHLTGVSLAGADLTHADLTGADLAGADLFNVHLSSANLRGANVAHANLDWTDLRAAIFDGANLQFTTLGAANLSRLRVRVEYLGPVGSSTPSTFKYVWQVTSLAGADLRHAVLSSANLYGANLNTARLDGASLRDANITNTNLANADLTNADLTGARMKGAQLQGATGLSSSSGE